jgi:LmbE family N-acetylglucosaminyl deacetylase
MSVLVIAAHPDDEVLGCGGTIARLSAEGQAVHVAILGEGVTSRYSQREQADPALLERLRGCSRRAAEILGARSHSLGRLPDNRFDTVPLLDIVKGIEDLVAQHQPEVIYTQHGGDLNLDHAITFRATLTAARPLPGCPVKAVYAYEVPSSTDWAFQQFQPRFQPNVFVDIHRTLEKKLQAMRCYESEARPFPHPRSSEALHAAAQRWGSAAGLPAAEAFQCVREIR